MEAVKTIRNDWTAEEVAAIYHRPLMELVYQAATVHRKWHPADAVQVCTLLSVKTGGCPEDCAYCGQAARYQTGITVQALLPKEAVVRQAKKALAAGVTRFCMAAAWRKVRDNKDFDRVLDMVRAVNELGLEVCCTLGMLTEEQAVRLQEAGLYAYNHNLDVSENFYSEIISTRTYQDRLDTLQAVRRAGLSVCCGGIIGTGETAEDRISLLTTLATLPEHPESVPVNALARVPGTPLEDQPKVATWELVRMIATARILMPAAMVRLSAGRVEMTEEAQALCFMAGANSIFTGEREVLLVTPNPSVNEDLQLLQQLGLRPLGPNENRH